MLGVPFEILRARITDEEGGSGVDEESVNIFIDDKKVGYDIFYFRDGQPMWCVDSFDATWAVRQGVHGVNIVAKDKAGNEATESISYAVDLSALSLSGLTGLITLPTPEVPLAPLFKMGIGYTDEPAPEINWLYSYGNSFRLNGRGWEFAVRLQLPSGGSNRVTDACKFKWVREKKRAPAIAVGEVYEKLYLVLGKTLGSANLYAGIGEARLKEGFYGLRFSVDGSSWLTEYDAHKPLSFKSFNYGFTLSLLPGVRVGRYSIREANGKRISLSILMVVFKLESYD